MGSSDICVGIMVDLDMCLTHRQTRLLHGKRRGKRMKRKALKKMSKRWPNGTIPFEIIDGAFGQQDILVINQAMLEWEHHTCLKFRRSRESDRDRLVIQTGAGCFSNVGRIGGPQPLVLGTGICRTKKVVVHEMAHAIGMIHEHQRPDRDSFIKVHLQNVKSRFVNQFDTFQSSAIDSYGVEYDYLSIMHYGKTFFAEDGISTTIETLDYAYQDMIGRTEELSFSDIKIVNSMYKCAEGCPNLNTLTCSDGGYLDKHCLCVCPDGSSTCVVEMSFGLGHSSVSTVNADVYNTFVPASTLDGVSLQNSVIDDPPNPTIQHMGLAEFTSANAIDWRSLLFGRNKVLRNRHQHPYVYSRMSPLASARLKRLLNRANQPLVDDQMPMRQTNTPQNFRFVSNPRYYV
ncbi:zinc metalloproteinase nas-1-like [Gigantopelta aegis]|uniref:zinc metalloproteinase nas-1-like n=1 Tax=Gigantopelta aegis TaxID=1735272 RepID=UPI001B88D9F9|nr:zinc metalloproteinase nas-1-like [Gigantopelta aegis]